MPDEDYMDDAPGKDSPMPTDKSDGDGEDKQGDAPTFLINSEVCPGMKPGDMLSCRVTAVHDKEYEVEYVPEEKEEQGEEMEKAPMPGASDGPPDSMMD